MRRGVTPDGDRPRAWHSGRGIKPFVSRTLPVVLLASFQYFCPASRCDGWGCVLYAMDICSGWGRELIEESGL